MARRRGEVLKQWSRARERCCMLISPPSACLPRSLLPPGLPPPRSLLPPAALPPFQRARRRRRHHPLPAPSLSRASFPPLASGTQPPLSRPSRVGSPRAARREHPPLGPAVSAPQARATRRSCALRPAPTPGRLLGVGRGPALLLPALGEEAKEPAFSCPLAFLPVD